MPKTMSKAVRKKVVLSWQTKAGQSFATKVRPKLWGGFLRCGNPDSGHKKSSLNTGTFFIVFDAKTNLFRRFFSAYCLPKILFGVSDYDDLQEDLLQLLLLENCSTAIAQKYSS